MNTNRTHLLYSFRRCPYAMRARMAIHYSGIQVEKIEVSLKAKPQALLDYSPKGTVPVVVTATGEVIEQSRDIMLWALQQSDPDNWLLNSDISAQAKMKQLIDTCDTEFKPLLDRYKYHDRHPEQSQADYRQQAEFFLQQLESQLTEHSHLIDNKLRLADVAIFPFIRQFAGVDSEWFAQCRFTNLQRWLNACVGSELFEAIMKK